MKIRETHTFLAALALTATLLCGCTKELPGDEPQPLPGEEVEVTLNLTPEMVASPFASSAAGMTGTSAAMTKAPGTASGGSMIAEVVDQPDTRALDDATVANAWVFQFNGSADNASLVSKIYRENITAATTFALKAGTNQRIVVLANSYDKTLGDALTSTSTYATLKALVRPLERAMEGAVPMSGNLVAAVASGTPLTVPLVRTFAKVTLKVKLGAGMTTTGWSAQVFEVAPSYWLPEATGNFPAADKLTGAYYTPQANLTFSTTAFTDLTFYLPVNRRGVVAGTSNFDRRTNAPAGSTYIKLSRSSSDPNMIVRTNYYVHLGANQTTDYNLRGNTQYTIKATLLTTTAGDSRSEYFELDVSDMQYAGMFGGKLEARNGVWQFTKELWVQKTDASTNTPWDTNSGVTTNVIDKVDGKGNTLALAKLGTRYAAAMLCFNKNSGLTASSTTVDNPAFQWYLPAQNQLMGVWTAHSSLSNAFASASFWASTEGNSSDSWNVSFTSGHTYINRKTSTLRSTRCVREM